MDENTNQGPERVVERERVVETGGVGGWVVAVVVLLIVVLVGWYYWDNSRTATPAPQQGASIDITIPTGSSDESNP